MWVGLGAMLNNISDYQTETDCHASSVAGSCIQYISLEVIKLTTSQL